MLSLASLVLGSFLALTPGQLLQRHAPVLVLHPQERFAPAAVDGFLADADLVGGRYDVRACSAREGLAALDCYAKDRGAPVVYGAVFRQGRRVALQYWLFYDYNLWSPLVPQSAQFWQAHEGDWEAITVLLGVDGRPETIGISRHCGGARRPWAKVERRGARPVVYVALGSHAHYFAPVRRLHDPQCWPSEAVAIFKAYGLPMWDYAARGRAVAPKVVRVTAASPEWMTFGGPWGEDQFVRFEQNVFKFGAGPRGPAFHELWRRPFASPAGWRPE